MKLGKQPDYSFGWSNIAGIKIKDRLLLFFLVLLVITSLLVGAFIASSAPVKEQISRLTEYSDSYNNEKLINFYKGLLAKPKKLKLDIKHTDLRKLAFFREKALEKGIIETTEESYVPLNITFDDKTYKGKIRLKGDLTDHLEGEKWSFRIKLKSGDYIMGMSSFSIQNPKRSGYIREWVAHKFLAFEGLIGLQYDFVEVSLNGDNLGIFALEESFSKELIERNQRREGPIIKFDETDLFHDKAYQKNYTKPQRDIYYEAKIESFNTQKTMASDSLKPQYLNARNLLYSIRDGKINLEDAIDVQRAARLFAAMDLVGKMHGLRWKNVRFYYNPITQKLELIGYNMFSDINLFDSYALMIYVAWSNNTIGMHVKDWLDIFFANETFLNLYFYELDRMTMPNYMESFFAEIENDYKSASHIIYKDGPLRLPTIDDFLKQRDITRKFSVPVDSLNLYYDERKSANSHSQILASNTSLVPLMLLEVICHQSDKQITYPVNMLLPTRSAENTIGEKQLELPFSKVPKSCVEQTTADGKAEYLSSLHATYNVPGQKTINQVRIQSDPIHLVSALMPTMSYNNNLYNQLAQQGQLSQQGDTLVLHGKNIVLDELYFFPPGYKIIIQPGTNITFNKGAGIISYSPLFISGEEKNRISIRGELGSYGLVVLNADQPSIIHNTDIQGLSAIDYGSWALTGSITFYESEVSISNSTFLSTKSEDLLNIIRSKFSITDSSFENSFSDMVDIDFGVGTISSSKFLNCGNDCLDVSGTDATIENLQIARANDKGISVGEGSNLEINNTYVEHSFTGVAVKDGSKTTLSSSIISSSNTAIAVYQKKSEYEKPSLIVFDTKLDDNKVKLVLEKGCSISIDGNFVDHTTNKYLLD